MDGKGKAPVALLVLYALNSFLFLVSSFFFLPDAIVKVLGSAAGVTFGVLGLKSLNPRESDGGSLITRHRSLFVGMLSAAAVFQGALLVIGFCNPCRIVAIPGSTIYVDGKFLARTPDPSGDIKDIDSWLTPRNNWFLLRWDTHEIKVTKKWYVTTKDLSQEFIKNVSVHWELWNPVKAFRDWKIAAELKPFLKITYGISQEPKDELGQAVKAAVPGWDYAWTHTLEQPSATYDRTDPYEVALEAVDGHVEIQIRDWTKHPLKPLRPIHAIERGDTDNQYDTRLSSIWDDAFGQLLAELGIPNQVQVSQPTSPLIALTQALNKEVSASQVSVQETPSPSPEMTPAILFSPAPGATSAQIGTPTPLPTSSPATPNVVKQLQTVATSAADNGRLDIALAAQKQLQAALGKIGKPTRESFDLARDLQQANAAVRQAIKNKSGMGRIYIHIADASQREPARKLQEVLVKDDRFAVIGIQNVGGRAYIPDTAEVRYFAFPNPPSTKQAAEQIVQILKDNKVSNVRPSYVIPNDRDKKESSDITTHFEIWFARDSFGDNR